MPLTKQTLTQSLYIVKLHFACNPPFSPKQRACILHIIITRIWAAMSALAQRKPSQHDMFFVSNQMAIDTVRKPLLFMAVQVQEAALQRAWARQASRLTRSIIKEQ